MARIAVGGFQHETNSFTTHRADFAHFAQHRDRPPFVRGDELLRQLRGNAFAMSGFLAAARPADDLVPLVWASCGAGGVVTDDAFERIVGELVGSLSAAWPVDAVYLDLHGAMVSASFDDAEGEILRRVRAVVGDAVPVVASLDSHANMSPAMLALADGLPAYRTYPHVDRPETGQRAAAILYACLEHGRPKGRALRNLPFLLPVDFQCTLVDPSRAVMNRRPADVPGIEASRVVDASYGAGFPPADTYWCGPAVAVYAATQDVADAAAAAASTAGVGAEIDLALGGRHGPAGVEPVSARFQVVACAAGPFTMTGQVTGRAVADLGPMALLRCGGVEVAVTSKNVQAYDPAPFARLGVSWETRRIVVLKSSCHFRADFEPGAAAVLSVLAPGAYDPDPRRYPYQRVRAEVRRMPARANAAGLRS